MKSIMRIYKNQVFMVFVLCFATWSLVAQNAFSEYKGIVVDNDNRNPLESVTLKVKNTNISTVTNADGKFILKVPESTNEHVVVFSLY